MEAGWHSAGNHAETDLNSNEMAAQLGFILPSLPIAAALPAASPASHPRQRIPVPPHAGAWGELAGMRSCSARPSRVADLLNGILMTWKPSACQYPQEHSSRAGVGTERGAAVAAEGRPCHFLCLPPATFPALPYFGGAEGGRGRLSPRSAVAVATAVSLAAENTFSCSQPEYELLN